MSGMSAYRRRRVGGVDTEGDKPCGAPKTLIFTTIISSVIVPDFLCMRSPDDH